MVQTRSVEPGYIDWLSLKEKNQQRKSFNSNPNQLTKTRYIPVFYKHTTSAILALELSKVAIQISSSKTVACSGKENLYLYSYYFNVKSSAKRSNFLQRLCSFLHFVNGTHLAYLKSI